MFILPSGAGTAGPAYPINNSLRFRRNASARLTRTPSSAGNRRTWTWSGWVKRGDFGADQWLFGADDGVLYSDITLTSDYLAFRHIPNTSGLFYRWRTPGVFRDPSAWYHIVVAVDTPQATGADRVRIYVNGAEQTGLVDAGGGGGGFIPQNTNTFINANVSHMIGMFVRGSSSILDGYLAEVHFVDGQALTPNDFGLTDTNGNWQPKAYGGTYGTNGWYLKFDDATSLTTLAEDRSGNANNWVATNVSLTAGATYDWMLDTPTNNFPTWNPLFRDSAAMHTITDGGLSAYSPAAPAGWQHTRATQTIPPSGKWYWEWTLTQSVGNGQGAALSIGAVNRAAFGNGINNGTGFAGLLFSTQTLPTDQRQISKMDNGGNTAYAGQLPAVNDVFSFAFDASTGKYWHGRNGVWYDSGDPGAGTNPSVTRLTIEELSIFQGSFHVTTPQYVITPVNFGQRPFAYTPPSGFNKLCTANLPAPTINDPRKHFDIKTRTGTGASASIAGYAFQPDLVWIKSRGRAQDHTLFDSVRGAQKMLESNQTGVESTQATGLTAFNSDGYTIGALDQINGTAAVNSFVDWAWKAGGAAASNNAGSISSQVSADEAAGISIVTYTGNAVVGATVGHGLGVAPKMMIIKSRSSAQNWPVYHASLTSAAWVLLLNSFVPQSSAATAFNSTAPTASVFSLGNRSDVNQNGATYVAYCFAEVPGFSKIGGYVGNGNADGPFVYCGFRPRWVLVKRITAGSDVSWVLMDAQRSSQNAVSLALFPNNVNAENFVPTYDFTANGFKIRTTDGGANTNAITYAFLAFAEAPLKLARAR